MVVKKTNIIHFRKRRVHHQKMWLTFLNVIVVNWSVAIVIPRGLSVQDETLERAARVKRLIGRPLESTLAERKSTTSYGEEPREDY